MNNKEIMDYAEEAIIHTYNRFPVVLDHGDGVYLYDVEGKKYLDFAAGIAVCAFGYNVKEYNDALKAQIDKMIHVSNLYYTQPMAEAAHKLVNACGHKKVFFTNSGTEDHEIIAMNHSFHGRSIGALSVTGNPHYQEAFKPLIDKVVFAEYNNLDDVASKITDKTCAIIMETVQGEGGIYPATREFIQGVRKLCDEKDILLILDEIQCGMGRTGKMFAYDYYDVKPDILTVAKALGCGVPIGAFVAGEKVEKALVAGDHGSTYGGNPLATAAANAVFDMFESRHILDNGNEVGDYLGEKLASLVERYDFIKETRGLGLMRGLEFTIPVGDIVAKSIASGLLIISAGTNIIRFVPPLVITKENVDEMYEKLDKILSEVQ